MIRVIHSHRTCILAASLLSSNPALQERSREDPQDQWQPSPLLGTRYFSSLRFVPLSLGRVYSYPGQSDCRSSLNIVVVNTVFGPCNVEANVRRPYRSNLQSEYSILETPPVQGLDEFVDE